MHNLVDDAYVLRESKKRKRHPAVRKMLFAAACLLVVAGVTVFSIPSARAAVEEWLSGIFNATEYFGQAEEEREKEPTIEAIITKVDGNNAKITKIGSGYEAYAKDFSMTLDEIAYDGESIFLTGTMSGATARPFVQVHTGGDTYRAAKYDGSLGGPKEEYYFFECDDYFLLTIDGGEYYGNIVATTTDDMEEIFAGSLDSAMTVTEKDGDFVVTNEKVDALWDAYLADHDVRFTAELLPAYIDMQQLTGMVEGDLSLRLFYGNVDVADATDVLTADFGKITIDANAYQQQTQTTQAKDDLIVDLGGVHPVTIEEWQPEDERTSDDCEVYYYTHELDFTGASYSLKEISFTPTDTKITLHVVLPKGWTGAERCNNGLTFKFLLDGETPENALDAVFCVEGRRGTADQTGKAVEYDCPFYESTLSPSQWASVKTLTIIPMTEYWWDMQVNYDSGPYKPFSLRDGAVFTSIANHSGFQNDLLYDEMTQYALTINLDDFR